MRSLLLVCFILQAFTITAQDNIKMTGTWTLAAMKDSEMFFDIKKDSFYFEEFEKLSAGERKMADSIFGPQKALLKEVLSQCYITFSPDLSFKGKIMDDVERSGKYRINEKEKTITLLLKKEGDKAMDSTETIKYKFEKERLIIYGFKGEGDLSAEFEKQ